MAKPKAKALIYAASIAALAAAVMFFAIDGRVYSTTVYVPQAVREPLEALHVGAWPFANAARLLLADPGWTPHDLVRKAYSLLAFAVLGFLIAKALGRRISLSRAIAVSGCVAGFSALIEILQRLDPSHESRLSSILDVLCGAIGGAAGYAVHAFIRRRLDRRSAITAPSGRRQQSASRR